MFALRYTSSKSWSLGAAGVTELATTQKKK